MKKDVAIKLAKEIEIAFNFLVMGGHFVDWRKRKFFREIIPKILIDMEDGNESMR